MGMLGFHRDNDPFLFESLLSLPALSTKPSSAWLLIDLDEPQHDGASKQLDKRFEDLQDLHSCFFQLQSHDVPLPKIESEGVSAASSNSEETPAADSYPKKDHLEYDGDIWMLLDVSRPQISTALISWDCFLQPSHIEPKSTYLSEAGPAAFDAALEQALSPLDKRLPSKFALPDKLISALFELGCGRQSSLFQWDNGKRTFRPISEEFGFLGTGQDIQDALTRDFISAGNTSRELADLVEESAAVDRSQHLFIALISAMSIAIYAVTRYLERERQNVRSLIQLQELFYKPQLLFQRLSKLAKIAKLGITASETMVKLMNEAQQLAGGIIWLEDVVSEVIMRTATPWLDAIADVIGLSPSTTRESLLRDSGMATALESGSALTLPSSIMPRGLSNLVRECETALEMLQVHEPDHPLLASTKAQKGPSISWECSWEAIEELQKQANEYEGSVKKAIQYFAHGSLEHEPELQVGELDVHQQAKSHVTMDVHVSALIDLESNPQWNQHLGLQRAVEDDRLNHLVSTSLSADEVCSHPLAPSLKDTLMLSISPLLKAQHRLLSCSVLHLLFKGHDFRSHLRMHHHFQLLADGSFVSRLTDALFDFDHASGGVCRRGQGKTGLKLQTRQTWPPASSELRLALTGVIADSFTSKPTQYTGLSKTQGPSLSDAMSFAIHDLSGEELEKCRDPDSIYALDFLRLQYKPPSLLVKAILTPASHRKYDVIFKHLLRLLRLRTVTFSLLRSVSSRNCKPRSMSDHRFRVEMQFFISTLAEYSANVAIRPSWIGFEALVEKVETSLDRGDFNGIITVAGSLQRLTDMHNEALDSMLRALCLDRQQVQARTLLEDTFGLILRTAALMRTHEEMTNEYDENVRTMYKEFRKQVGRFVRYLRVQSGPLLDNGSAGAEEAFAFEQLLLRLNMFDYYG